MLATTSKRRRASAASLTSEADLQDDLPGDLEADIEGEPWTEYHELGDEGWETLKPFLPEPMGEDRALISGALWVFTTRRRWQDMPVPGLGR